MKKLITALFILFSNVSFPQGGAMADLKFEEAEIAFNRQDFETTIKKLDEFDKLMGSVKDKSLYLRIVSQDKLFQPSKLYLSDGESQFNLLSSLRKNASAYLKAMESGGLDDRYREIYAIGEKLKQYPTDKQAWLKINQAVEKERAKIKAEKEMLDNYYKIKTPEIESWEWYENIKIGSSFFALKKLYPNFYKNFDEKIKKTDYVDGSFITRGSKNILNPSYGEVKTIRTENDIINLYTLSFGFLDEKKKNELINNTLSKWNEKFGEACIRIYTNKDTYGTMTVYLVTSPLTKHRIGLYSGQLKSGEMWVDGMKFLQNEPDEVAFKKYTKIK